MRAEGISLHDEKVFVFTIRIGMSHMSNGQEWTGYFSWDKVVRNAYRIFGENTLETVIGKLRQIREL
jgi:hypothetical protein